MRVKINMSKILLSNKNLQYYVIWTIIYQNWPLSKSLFSGKCKDRFRWKFGLINCIGFLRNFELKKLAKFCNKLWYYKIPASPNKFPFKITRIGQPAKKSKITPHTGNLLILPLTALPKFSQHKKTNERKNTVHTKQLQYFSQSEPIKAKRRHVSKKSDFYRIFQKIC